MGSATRATLKRATDRLRARELTASVELADGLFTVADALRTVPQLRSLVADPATDVDRRRDIMRAVFSSRLPADVLGIVEELVVDGWSSPREMAEGFDRIGLTTLAAIARDTVGVPHLIDELFGASRIFAENRDLQLAIPARSLEGPAEGLVGRLFGEKVDAETLAFISHAVVHHRGGMVASVLVDDARLAADMDGRELAIVTSAFPLDDRRRAEVVAGVSSRFGKDVYAGYVVDPAVIGGMRVEVGAQVIDATTRMRLGELRASLAQ